MNAMIPTPDQFRREAGVPAASAGLSGAPAGPPMRGPPPPQGPLMKNKRMWLGVMCAAAGAIVGVVITRQMMKRPKK